MPSAHGMHNATRNDVEAVGAGLPAYYHLLSCMEERTVRAHGEQGNTMLDAPTREAMGQEARALPGVFELPELLEELMEIFV